MDKYLVIGIAGGSGSGKTTLMNNLIKVFGADVTVISHDNYYKRHDELSYEERCQLNYDEPAAFDTDLLVAQLEQLRCGRAIDCPVYDFTVHNRSDKVIHVVPRKVIIVEGILIFENKQLRELMDIRIFVDTDADIRLCRRVKRDVNKRGRTLESVLSQYQTTVKPMHEKYVEPSKKYAHLVVLEGGKNTVALDMIIGRIKQHLQENEKKPESLIFDIDGTLWDSTELVAIGYNRQLQKENYTRLTVTADMLRALFGRTMQDIADRLFPDVEVPERYDLMERCMASEGEVLHADPCNVAYPGVVETLTELAKSYRLFIVSNSQTGYPQLLIDKLGIGALISGHLCYGDTGTGKGETILTLMKQHNITDAVYIGDTQGDLESSEHAGLPFVFCAYGFGKPDHYDYRVEAFTDLTTLFPGKDA